MTTAAELASYASSFPSFRNRIINGDMRIDQRNAGGSVTPANATNTYVTDRWSYYISQPSKLTAQQSTTTTEGFKNSLLTTSSSTYEVITNDLFIVRQKIEGFDSADLEFGTSNAKTITISFWVRSSLTGMFGGAVKNSAPDRAYPFSYTINAADTFEFKTITVPGDTTGTWLTDNGIGIQVVFGLGAGLTYSGTAGAWVSGDIHSVTGATSVVGTSGATFYITGVQLEVGTVATEFEHRPISVELSLAQRYYERWNATGGNGDVLFVGQAIGTNQVLAGPFYMKVTKRALPEITYSNASHFLFTTANNSNNQTGTLDSTVVNKDTFRLYSGSIATSPLVAGNCCIVAANTSSAYVEMKAEL